MEDVVVVVVPEELELLDESSFFAQEITVRLKQEIRKTNKNFFIFSSIPKVKYYCLFNENVKYNINRFVIQCEGYFTWRVSDCEELVGVTHRR